MSDEHLPYSPCYIKAWSILATVVGLCLLFGFVFCNQLLAIGGDIWGVIRCLFSPII